MLRTPLRSARGRSMAVALAAATAVGFALPASAGLLAPDNTPARHPSTASARPTAARPTAAPTGTGGLHELLDHLAGGCAAATRVPARLLSTPIDLSACDLRGTLVQAGALTVRIPGRAHSGATAASLLSEEAPPNAVTTLSVVNTGGEIVVDVLRADQGAHRGSAQRHQRSNASAQDPCSARAYAYIGTRNDALRWQFNRATTPSYLAGGSVASAITEGARIISTGRNDCGLAELGNIKQSYAGLTSRHADCSGPDGHNVADFGPRPPYTLATTCWWYANENGGHQVIEVDLRFQEEPGTFYQIEPGDCRGQYNLTGVAAHEFGHAFGLAHVSEDQYPHQTMSYTAPACSYEQESLGRGDWLGLRNLYGK